jgi:GWxTD domain-containing protein
MPRSLRRRASCPAAHGPGKAALVVLAAAWASGCSAPISTIRSPAHPRIVEVRNTTEEERLIEIEPAALQHLGTATTFTGRLRPGETKILYLYDGFTYQFRLVASRERDDVRQDFRVASDMRFDYAGDSLVVDENPSIEVGPPTLVGSATYENATEAQLDALVRQLDVFLPRPAVAAYAGLPLDSKRAFLLHFWAEHDPTPGTPQNEYRTQVEERLTVVESRFRAVGEPGAATARGRIYLRYGKPDRLVARTLTTEFAKPYEVWQYFSTGYMYVFLDDLRSGRFLLLTSTDPNEPGVPDWQERLPPDAAEEILGPSAGPSRRETERPPSTLDRGAPAPGAQPPSQSRLPLSRGLAAPSRAVEARPPA